MYTIVTTPEQHTQFEKIWRSACVEKGYVHESCHPTATRFLFTNENGVPVGTLELLPFQPQTFTTINDMFAFDQHPSVIAAQEKTYEIDKLTIVPEYRGHGVLNEILAAIVHFASANDITHYVSMLDSLFLRVLRIQFGLKIENSGSE